VKFWELHKENRWLDIGTESGGEIKFVRSNYEDGLHSVFEHSDSQEPQFVSTHTTLHDAIEAMEQLT